MLISIITLLTALSISAVAAFYSIVGLMAIFSASATSISVMGIVLEIGKLVTATWLYHSWDKIPRLLKYYLTLAVIVLMFITSMGIFGYLSKAHIEQTKLSSDYSIQVDEIEDQIERQYKDIERSEKQLNLLDETLEKYIELGAVTKSIKAREGQQEERDKLNNQIIVTTDNISDLKKKKYSLQSEQNKLESEVGPIKYIAELIYGESSSSILDDAVRMVILTLVFVFDPLAVLLIIAANISINEYNEKRKIVKEKKSEGDITTTVQKKGEFREVVKEQNGVEIKYYE
jgi:hypothetical protein|tara:strand:- start:499 stop:1362 length:864 start_codon:yes stop_codon:yes gene_type:complete